MYQDSPRLTSRGGVSYLLYSNHQVPIVLVRCGSPDPAGTGPEVSGFPFPIFPRGARRFLFRKFLKAFFDTRCRMSHGYECLTAHGGQIDPGYGGPCCATRRSARSGVFSCAVASAIGAFLTGQEGMSWIGS